MSSLRRWRSRCHFQSQRPHRNRHHQLRNWPSTCAISTVPSYHELSTHRASKLPELALLLLLARVLLKSDGVDGSSNRRLCGRGLVHTRVGRAEWAVHRLLRRRRARHVRCGGPVWLGRRWRVPGCVRGGNGGHGRRDVNGAGGIELFDVVGGEETLAAAAATSPPIGVGFIDDFYGLSGGEREVVRFLGRIELACRGLWIACYTCG